MDYWITFTTHYTQSFSSNSDGFPLVSSYLAPSVTHHTTVCNNMQCEGQRVDELVAEMAQILL